MLGLLLLSALGFAALLALPLFDRDDDQDQDDDPPPPPREPILLQAGDSITGDSGSDHYLTDRPDGTFDEVDALYLDAGAGPDRVDADLYQATVLGGDGTDRLRVSGIGLTVDGGAGNDVLTGTPSNEEALYRGGDGNDWLSVTSQSADATFDGGAGDDTIRVSVPAGLGLYENFWAPTILTGPGSDVVMVKTAPTGKFNEEGEISYGSGFPFVRIDDFDPNRDVLGIEVPESPGRELHHLELRSANAGQDT
jgi:hypothetical protein